MIIDWFKNKLGVLENWDKHDYDMARYSFNDMVDFAEQYYSEQLAIQHVSNSYAVVRWHDNEYEDVVCANKDVALEYIQKYNNLAGEELCYLDEDIWLPLSKA